MNVNVPTGYCVLLMTVLMPGLFGLSPRSIAPDSMPMSIVFWSS